MARPTHRPLIKAAGSLLSLALLVACSPASGTPTTAPVPPTPSVTAKRPGKGTVATPTTSLSLRREPTTASARLTGVPNGTVVTIICTIRGEAITHRGVRTPIWDKVKYKGKTGYLSAAYVKGGTSSELPKCDASKKPSATPTPTPTTSSREGVEPRIIDIARSQLGVTEKKNNCNPYGGCMAWCSLYATWVWRKAGNPIPQFPFTGDLYTWGQKHNRSHPGTEGVGPGDLVLYGTSPKTVKTSTHVDIVIEVVGDDKLRVIGGNVKNKVAERVVPRKGIYGWVDA